MANTQIDSLSLDIKITGLEKEDITNLDKLSKAVSRLTKALKDADFSKLNEIQVPKGIKDISLVTQNIKIGGSENTAVKDEKNVLAETQKALEEFSSVNTEEAKKLEDSSLKIENASENTSLALVKLKKQLEELNKVLNGGGKGGSSSGGGKTTKELNKMQKFFKRFKTIAFIKAIRAILNAIVQLFKVGVTNLANFDKEFNATMSNIKTSVIKIANSLALIVRPLIETLEPYIKMLGDSFAKIGNEVSRLQAIIKGTNTYTKINAKYMADFANSAQKASLFSFDTFNTLNASADSGMFETANLEEDNNDSEKERLKLIQNIQKTIQNIVKLVTPIIKEVIKLIEYLMPALNLLFDLVNEIVEVLTPFIADLLEALDPLFKVILQDLLPALLNLVNAILMPLLNNVIAPILPLVTQIVDVLVVALVPVLDLITTILNAISPYIEKYLNWLTNIKSVVSLISSIISFWGNIFSVVGIQAESLKNILTDIFKMDWHKLGDDLKDYWKKLGKSMLGMVGSMFDGVINFIIDAINNIGKPINKIAKKLKLGFELKIDYHSNFAEKLASFANGGIVGELWQMNEYGNPEMLYNANGGSNTSVINQAQLSLAFEQAIYNTGLLEAIQEAGIIQIDGRDIAQSKNFKAELNRTNPSLNIR